MMECRWKRGIVTSKAMLKIPNLAQMLGVETLRYVPPWSPFAFGAEVVFGWGRKPSSLKAQTFAQKYGLPFVTVEDGFLRSSGLGVMATPPLSLAVDDLGVHFDWRTPSRLEQLILSPPKYSQADWQFAQLCLQAVKENRLSKYNLLPYEQPPPKAQVLVVDQTRDDASLITQQDTEQVFFCMLQQALRDNPDKTVCVRVHPDVVAGKKRGYLYPLPFEHPRLMVDSVGDSAWDWFDQIDDLYTVSSLLGFEALMHQNVRVHCFGLPFYAGWGLTHDALICSWRNGCPQTLLQLFMAAYVTYPSYWDESNRQVGEVDSAINSMLNYRYRFLRKRNHPKVKLVGISRWKRRWVKDFLKLWGMEEDPNSPHRVVWGMKDPDKPCYARIEDGFLRSKGLGALGHRPISLICDFSGGIYFNTQRPSDIDWWLENYQLSEWEKLRAQKLLDHIREHRLTKYNLREDECPAIITDKKKILVIGQVESDASIQYGSPLIKTNEQLLQITRIINPDAYIVYKSHPDVCYQCRENGVFRQRLLSKLVNKQVDNQSIASLSSQIDEITINTSLSGLESHFYFKTMNICGLPFYRKNNPVKNHNLFIDYEIDCALLSLFFVSYGICPAFNYSSKK